MNLIDNLLGLLSRGQDNVLLRYSLAHAYFKQGDASAALPHVQQALRHDANYSAAWKLYGAVLTALDRTTEALAVYDQGIAVAEKRGDLQAAKEMRVFARRLQKTQGDDSIHAQ